MAKMAKMAKKKSGDQKGALAGALATTAAVWLVRKALTAVWTRATGKVPPTDPSDPKFSVIETLGWAVIAGASIEATRLLAARATTRRARTTVDSADG
jgi:hypothetical protein